MTIRELLQEVKLQIGPEGDHLGAELLLAFVLDRKREYLPAHPDEVLSREVVQRFYALFDRMIAGEPVAYLLGKKEFYGLDFLVDRRVLIPRPETEHLVEWVLNYFKNSPPGPGAGRLRILDLGTGSGCIAVSLAKHLPSAEVTGSDISSDALKVAEENARNHDVSARMQLVESDLLVHLDEPFDIIVANLPYIGEKRFSFVSKSALDYEPHVALFGGDDGLYLYQRFFEQLSEKSWRPKIVVGEFGFLQRDELEILLKQSFPTQVVRFEQDYAHIDRMFVVEFPGLQRNSLPGTPLGGVG